MDIIVAGILSEDRKDCLRGKQMCLGLPAGFKGNLFFFFTRFLLGSD